MAARVDIGKESWYEQFNLPEEYCVDEELFQELWDLHPEEYGKVKMYNYKTKNYEEINTPRWQQSFGKDYKFTGMNHKASKITHPFLLKLLDFVKDHSGLEYNQVLVNWYNDGQHYIGAHSDDERQLVPDSSIYSFSFGQVRDFVIKNKKYSVKDANRVRIVLQLDNNSCVIMGGKMQKYFTHEVPKRSIKKCAERRINVTMRLFK